MDRSNVAASGWGAPIPEEPIDSKYSSQQTSEDGSEYSDDDFEYDSDEDDDEEDDYAPLQMGAWGAQPTGAQADDNAIQMPNWNERPRDETPSLTFTSADWGKLCDPKVVVKAGIGSGNLHRRGANYKPVDEQQILNQRLKIGSPIPSGKKKKRGGKKSKGPPPRPKAPKAPKPLKAPSAPRRPPLTQSAWGGAALSSTPFWESGGAKSSKYASNPTPPPPPTANKVNQQPPPPNANKVNQQPPPPSQQRLPGGRPAPTGGAASRWANQPLLENFVPPAPAPAPTPQHQQQQPVRTPAPIPAAAAPTRHAGSAASKYAPAPAAPQVPSPVAPSPQQQQQQQQQQPSIPVHGTISLSDLSTAPPARKTIFQLNIELTAGVGAILPVYETDDYVVLVKEFGAKHHLTISPEAEATFAEKIRLMVAALKKQQAEQ